MNNSMQQQSQFNIDRIFSEDELINDLDPMLESGSFKVAFNRPCPFQVRQNDSEGQQYGTRQMLGVRIMANGTLQSYTQIKIQITSETNLFLIYECKLDNKKFDKLKKMQSLNFNFSNLLAMLIKQLNLCDKFPQQYSTVLYIAKSGQHNLTIIQNIEYKSIELLALDFQTIDAELKKQCVSFRFSLLKARNEKIENKTKEMLSLVKLKNPNLLQSIVKKTNSTTLGTTLMLSRINKSSAR